MIPLLLMFAGQVNTTCQQFGTITNCSSTGGVAPNPGPDYGALLRNQQQQNAIMQNNMMGLAAMARARREARAAQAQQDAANNLEFEHRAIGQMVARGQCVTAKNEALAIGDLDLAQQVVQLCVQVPPPPMVATGTIPPPTAILPAPKP